MWAVLHTRFPTFKRADAASQAKRRSGFADLSDKGLQVMAPSVALASWRGCAAYGGAIERRGLIW